MATDRIAIFPLSNVVLFPGVQTPLHLFEERYRQLAADALAGDRRIGMVVVPPEHVADLPGNPRVFPIGCAGSIVQHQRLPDGRYNIVLAGEARFRIESEPDAGAECLYRVAEVTWLEDPLPERAADQIEALRGRIEAHIVALVKRDDPVRAAELEGGVLPGADATTFVNTLSNALGFATPEKQGLLEADDIAQRCERLEGLLAFRVAESHQPARGSDRPH